MHLRVVVAAAALLATGAPAASAENCVDKEVARTSGGRPCLDVGASMGRFEAWQAPGFLDVRLSVMRIGLYGNGAARRGGGFELASWEAIGSWDGIEGIRDLDDRAAARLITGRYQVDHDRWGAYVAGDLVHQWFGTTRGFTPRLGLRLGRADEAAVIVEAAFAGVFLFGSDGSHRSLTRDLDVGARATMTLSRRWRLEARGRYRDLVAADGYQLRDASAAIGVNVEASPRGPGPRTPEADRMRVMTLFVGLAARRPLIDAEPGEPAVLSTGRGAPSSREPWQLMAWLDLDLAIETDHTIW